MINNKELSTNSINCYENNSQFISRLAILILANASKDLIDDDEQFKEINTEIYLKRIKNALILFSMKQCSN